jgi:hypothetical protein
MVKMETIRLFPLVLCEIFCKAGKGGLVSILIVEGFKWQAITKQKPGSGNLNG